MNEIDSVISETIQRAKDALEIMRMIEPFFHGDEEKMRAWYAGSNNLLGGLSPIKMVMMGKTDKLKKFIQNQLEENKK